MKRILFTLFTGPLLSLALPAFAEDAPASDEPLAEQPAANHFMVRAPIVDPGETIDVSDILAVTRGFDTWNLGCSVRISSGRRSCSIEQVVIDSERPVGSRSSVRWGIGSSAANRSFLFVHVTSNFSLETGMRMTFAGVEKTIAQQEWFCSDQGCIVSLPFDGILQAAIQSSQEIGFLYKVKTPGGELLDINLRGHMSGFDKALRIAAKNPFAPVEVAKQADQGKAVEAKKTLPAKASVAPKKKETVPAKGEADNAPAKPKNAGLY